jgi:hypothetical protein
VSVYYALRTLLLTVWLCPVACSDCWAKFLDSSTILVSRVPEEHPLYEDYEAAAEFFAEFYTLVRVDVGMATNPYTNSLIVNVSHGTTSSVPSAWRSLHAAERSLRLLAGARIRSGRQRPRIG